jgi:ubiquitin carboxyl-terminal hydrolase 4/11/15
LFYRRQSDEPLGGPKFKEIKERMEMAHEQENSSRASSSAGEGQPLVVDSFQNGSSNVLVGAEAAHLEAGSGVGKEPTLAITNHQSESPPAYSRNPQGGERAIHNPDDIDERMDSGDEGIDMTRQYDLPLLSNTLDIGPKHWFPTSDAPSGEDEKLFDDDSTKAAGAGGSSADLDFPSDRDMDFDDSTFSDQPPLPQSDVPDDVSQMFSTDMYGKNIDADITSLEVKASMTVEDEEIDDAPVAEVHLDDGEGLKMD